MKTTRYQRGFIGFLVRVTTVLFIPACIALILYGSWLEIGQFLYEKLEENCWNGYSNGSVDCQLKRWQSFVLQKRQGLEPITLQPFPRVKKKSNVPLQSFSCADLAIEKEVERRDDKARICAVEAAYAAALTYNRALREEKYNATFSNSPQLGSAKESREIAGQIYDTLLKVAENPARDWLLPVTVAGVKTTPYVLREIILPERLASKQTWDSEVLANPTTYRYLSTQLLQQRTSNW